MFRGHLKKLASDSVVYGLGGIVSRLIGFFLVPLFTRFLKPEDYGIMSMLALLSMLLSGVFTLGTGNSMGIFYFEAKDRAQRDQIIWTTALLLLSNIGLLLCLCSVLSPYLSLLILKTRGRDDYIILALSGFALQNLAMPFVSYLRMERKPWIFFWLTLLSSLLTVALNVVAVVVLGLGVKGMLEVTILVGALYLILIVILVARQVPFNVNLSWIPRLVKTGFPSIFGVGAFLIVDMVDRAFVQRFCGMNELGIYSIGYNFGMVMILFAEGSFGSAWSPYFMSFINRREEAVQVLGKVFRYAILGYGMLALLFFAAARPVVAVMTAAPFHAAWTVVGMVAASYVMKVLYLILLPPICFEKKLHLQTSIEWVAAILNIGLNFLLIPTMKKEGAALATLASYLLLPALTLYVGQKLMRVQYEWRMILPFCAAAGLVATLTFFSVTGSLWGDAVLNILALCLLSVITMRFFMTVAERHLLLRFVGKLPGFKARVCSSETI